MIMPAGSLRTSETPLPRVRVCVLTPAFFPFVGGGETYALNVATRLRRLGAEVFVLTRRTSPELAVSDDVQGVPVYRVGPTGTLRWAQYLMMWPVAWRLWTWRRRYDVIYVSNFKVLGLIAVLMAKLLHKRCVLRGGICGELSGRYAELDGASAKRVMRRAGWLLSLRTAWLKRADLFVANSAYMAYEYREAGVPESRVVCLPGGVDTDVFRPAAGEDRAALRRRLQLPENGLLIGYSGKLNKGKGLQYLIEAMPGIRERIPAAHAVLIGGSRDQLLADEESLRQRMIEAGVSSHVTITGYTHNVRDYLRALDAFVLPTEFEALPNALMEAMAVGLPCVATRVGGIPDLIEHERNGLLVEPGAVGQLADAVARFARDSSLAARCGHAARQTMKARFHVWDLAERLTSLLERLTLAPMGAVRVLIVTNRALPAIGGSQHFFDALCRFLVAQGAAAKIAAMRMPRDTQPPQQPHDTVYGPTLRELWRLVRWASVVHTLDFDYRAWLFATLQRKPLVVVYHTAARICPKGMGWNGREVCGFDTHWRECVSCLHKDRSLAESLWKWVSLPIKQRLADSADAVVNLSQYTARRFGVRDSLTILHGIDLHRFVPSHERKREAFLFAGRLVPEKGGEVLMRAMETYVRLGGTVPLDVVGDGPERANLEGMVRQFGMDGMVRFHGMLEGERFLNRLQSAVALVMPVLWAETFGRVAFEAMACGTPIVAAELGVFEDIAREAGLTFPPGNADALAEQLVLLAGDSALQAQLQQRSLQVVQQYSLDKELSAYGALYRRLVGCRFEPVEETDAHS